MRAISENCQKGRLGLTVQQVIDILLKIEDKDTPCCIPSIGLSFEMEGIKQIKEATLNGYAGSYSYEKTDVVAFI